MIMRRNEGENDEEEGVGDDDDDGGDGRTLKVHGSDTVPVRPQRSSRPRWILVDLHYPAATTTMIMMTMMKKNGDNNDIVRLSQLTGIIFPFILTRHTHTHRWVAGWLTSWLTICLSYHVELQFTAVTKADSSWRSVLHDDRWFASHGTTMRRLALRAPDRKFIWKKRKKKRGRKRKSLSRAIKSSRISSWVMSEWT